MCYIIYIQNISIYIYIYNVLMRWLSNFSIRLQHYYPTTHVSVCPLVWQPTCIIQTAVPHLIDTTSQFVQQPIGARTVNIYKPYTVGQRLYFHMCLSICSHTSYLIIPFLFRSVYPDVLYLAWWVEIFTPMFKPISYIYLTIDNENSF